jgi:hypothetical protein
VSIVLVLCIILLRSPGELLLLGASDSEEVLNEGPCYWFEAISGVSSAAMCPIGSLVNKTVGLALMNLQILNCNLLQS